MSIAFWTADKLLASYDRGPDDDDSTQQGSTRSEICALLDRSSTAYNPESSVALGKEKNNEQLERKFRARRDFMAHDYFSSSNSPKWEKY